MNYDTVTVDGWTVRGLSAYSTQCSDCVDAELELCNSGDSLHIWSWTGDPSRAPIAVIIAILRNAGYTVTPPTPDCCGRGCGECKEEA